MRAAGKRDAQGVRLLLAAGAHPDRPVPSLHPPPPCPPPSHPPRPTRRGPTRRCAWRARPGMRSVRRRSSREAPA
eukprot:1055515-Rhodomonas_salina.1